jgi:putative ABC transport system substrate-binding protein
VTDRRAFLIALGATAAAPRLALGQFPGRTHRLGVLSASGVFDVPYWRAFRQRLRELGFVEGRNLEIVYRWSKKPTDTLFSLAADLARQNCDVLVSPGNEAILRALEQPGGETPIVVIAVDFDPVATGHVASLARPGGRITGVSALQAVLPAKRLELMKELLPKAVRVAVLTDPSGAGQLEVARAAATRLALEIQVLELERAPYDYAAAFAEAARKRAQAMLVLGSAFFVPARPLITRLAIEHRLPAMFHHSVWAEAGGLASYGANFSDIFSLAADQVVRVLKGGNPGDTPIEQPTRFELVVNLRTARAIGVTIPRPVLLRADRVIE